MKVTLKLTEQEALLRELLTDTAHYIGGIHAHNVPQLRFTGGWVRDKLLGSASHDIDVGIDNMTGIRFGHFMKQYLELEETTARYSSIVLGTLAKIEANPEKSKHLETATTRVLGCDIDLVNLRKETYTERSRNPVVEFGSPEEDALRRDATINALFYNLSSGQVEDFTGRGLSDLERKVIKTPLSPLETFRDDPLRVLRAIRFASRLNFAIDEGDLAAMKDQSIKDALRVKISRERVGVELIKMLQGPNPHQALYLIDEIGLYGTIFTNQVDYEFSNATVIAWSRAYNLLRVITEAQPAGEADTENALHVISEILLRNADDQFFAWVVCCFVPWARVRPSPSAKPHQSAAYSAARESIKADNKISRIVDEAGSNLESVIEFRMLATERINEGDSLHASEPQKLGRDRMGLTIRGWGPHWRYCVMFALLTEALEADGPREVQTLVEKYAAWLSTMKMLDLLDVENLKPIVNGKQVLEAVGGKKSGPWMKTALDIAIAWQLRNPAATDPSDAIAHIMSHKEEIGIT